MLNINLEQFNQLVEASEQQEIVVNNYTTVSKKSNTIQVTIILKNGAKIIAELTELSKFDFNEVNDAFFQCMHRIGRLKFDFFEQDWQFEPKSTYII